MLPKDFIQSLGDRLDSKNLTDDTVRTLLLGKINESAKEIGRIHEWDYLKVYGSFNTVPNYVDGTVSITNGSRTITGSGTTWTAFMVGRYFQPSSSANWYKIIAFVSTTELTLETQIIESTNNVSYVIWKRFYYLPSSLRKVKIFEKWVSNYRVEEVSLNKIIDNGFVQSNTGTPTDVIDSGADPFESSYSAGSVSLTLDSNVMTGLETLWLDNVEAGERITVGGRIFRVKRVESDTRIIMWNYSTTTLGNQAYTIEKDNPIGFQLFPSPDTGYVIQYVGYARVFDVVNENKDRFQFPEDFDVAIVDGAEASRMRDLDDAKWLQKVAEFKGRIIDLKASMGISKPRKRQVVPDIGRRGNL